MLYFYRRVKNSLVRPRRATLRPRACTPRNNPTPRRNKTAVRTPGRLSVGEKKKMNEKENISKSDFKSLGPVVTPPRGSDDRKLTKHALVPRSFLHWASRVSSFPGNILGKDSSSWGELNRHVAVSPLRKMRKIQIKRHVRRAEANGNDPSGLFGCNATTRRD